MTQPILTPQLAMRERHASAAFISLSPGLVCQFTAPTGATVTHQQVGALGLTAHQAWDLVARSLLATAQRGDGVEFWVRPAATRLPELADTGLAGYEVRGAAAPPAAWLAHPTTFSTLQRHFAHVFGTDGELTYYTRDKRELFVFDAPADDVAAVLGAEGVVEYSLGFPLLRRRHPAIV